MYLKSRFGILSINFPKDENEFDILCGDIYRNNYSNQYEHIWINYINWFELFEVENAIKSLSIKKDNGPMQISAEIIKRNINILPPILLKIFNAILECGNFLTNWKKSYIIPIPKKGNYHNVNNYRGIALQSVIPKLFDQLIITNKLKKFIDIILPDEQHGFKTNKGTISNLTETTQFIHDEFANGNQVDIIQFDYTKAFETLDH